eukprot:3910268-Rhodomonas_salina.1
MRRLTGTSMSTLSGHGEEGECLVAAGGQRLGTVAVDGLGVCVEAIGFVSMVCNKNRKQSYICIHSMLHSKRAAAVKKILCRKVQVPGRADPQYVLTYSECFHLVEFLPKQRVSDIKEKIHEFFTGGQTEDQLRCNISDLGKRK